jgi:O-antigen ligase
VKPLLVTYILTFGGAAASLIRPYTGFLIYVAFGIIKPDSLWAWAIPQWNYSRIVAIGFLLGWVLHGCGSWRLGRGAVALGCLVGYWLVLLLGAATAPIPELGWHPVEPMAKVFLPIVAGATLIDSVQKLRQLAWVIVLCQGYLAYEFNLHYIYSPLFIPWEWTHGGLDNNGIAITMVTSIGMAFFLGIHAPKIWQRLVALGCAALMAHVVLFSNSRGGMLSLIVTGAVAFLLLPKRPVYLLVFGLAVAGALATSGENVQKRFLSAFASKEEGSDQGGRRLENWRACLDTMSKTPFGVGPCHWRTVAPSYGLPAMEAHSTWLQMGAELGLPGLACLAGFYLITLRRLYPFVKKRRPVADPCYQYLARMVISSLAGFLAAAQFVTIDGVELPYYIALVGIGVLKLTSTQEGGTADLPAMTGRVPASHDRTEYL